MNVFQEQVVQPTTEAEYRDLIYGLLLNAELTITARLPEGRKFRYKIGDLLRQLAPGHDLHHVEVLADQAMQEKYRFCWWDEQHPTVNSESQIREVLVAEFTRYLEWLKRRADKNQQMKPADS